MGLIEWFKPGVTQVNRAKRVKQPPISAFYWNGGCSLERTIKDISTSGALLSTPKSEKWYLGTVITVLLQLGSESSESSESSDTLSVPCKIVRDAEDGIGVKFILSKPEERKSLERFLRRAVHRGVSAQLMRARNTEGQALVEFALMVPFLFLLILITVNFATFLYGWITVANAARAGTQYAILGGASVGGPATPSNSQIQALIAGDTSSLHSSVSVCINTNTTTAAITGTCSFTIASIPADPEAPFYTIIAVDVNYPFTPLFQHFGFPTLGITDLPGMPTSIQRRVLMRILN
jgi:Flp pilus assembly protein TadG